MTNWNPQDTKSLYKGNPNNCLAKDKRFGTIDFFWRIDKDNRESISEPNQWILQMRRLSERIREEGPDGPRSRYVDNSYMWEDGFKFPWEDWLSFNIY